MKKVYLTPSVVTEEVRVEKGFAQSQVQANSYDLQDFEDDGEAW